MFETAKANERVHGTKSSNVKYDKNSNELKSYIASVDEKLLRIVENVENGSNESKRYLLSVVSKKQVDDIKNILGYEFTGYRNTIKTDEIKHIIKRHKKTQLRKRPMPKP